MNYPPRPPPPPQPPSFAIFGGLKEKPEPSFDYLFEPSETKRDWKWWTGLGWLIGSAGLLLHLILQL